MKVRAQQCLRANGGYFEGKKQFVNKCPMNTASDDANQMMLVSDMVLAWDPGFRAVLEEYAEDEDKLTAEFATAFKKLTELGCNF